MSSEEDLNLRVLLLWRKPIIIASSLLILHIQKKKKPIGRSPKIKHYDRDKNIELEMLKSSSWIVANELQIIDIVLERCYASVRLVDDTFFPESRDTVKLLDRSQTYVLKPIGQENDLWNDGYFVFSKIENKYVFLRFSGNDDLQRVIYIYVCVCIESDALRI